MVEAVLLQHADGGGPELGKPADLGIDKFPPGGERHAAAAAGVDVKMDPVLDRLAFRTAWNQLPGPPPPGSTIRSSPIPRSSSGSSASRQ
jgi:hypothetical protein